MFIDRGGKRRTLWLASFWLLGGMLAFAAGCAAVAGPAADQLVATTPAPTADRLAEPPLPDDPTPYEAGRHLYWLHCMPCHGDQGQGLTGEFRGLWEEDHRNCWGRGCHAGREGDEGFPLPRAIPAIIPTAGENEKPANPEKLVEFLHTSHPPQDPGCLAEAECRALAAYVLAEREKLTTSR